MLLVGLRAARCGALDPRLVDSGAQPNVTARPQALRRARPGAGTRTASASAFPTTTPLSNCRWCQELPARSPDATARSSNHNTSRSLWIQEEEGTLQRRSLVLPIRTNMDRIWCPCTGFRGTPYVLPATKAPRPSTKECIRSTRSEWEHNNKVGCNTVDSRWLCEMVCAGGSKSIKRGVRKRQMQNLYL